MSDHRLGELRFCFLQFLLVSAELNILRGKVLQNKLISHIKIYPIKRTKYSSEVEGISQFQKVPF